MISAEHFRCEHMAGRPIVVLIGGGFDTAQMRLLLSVLSVLPVSYGRCV